LKKIILIISVLDGSKDTEDEDSSAEKGKKSDNNNDDDDNNSSSGLGPSNPLGSSGFDPCPLGSDPGPSGSSRGYSGKFLVILGAIIETILKVLEDMNIT
jgi:hypothetical protein